MHKLPILAVMTAITLSACMRTEPATKPIESSAVTRLAIIGDFGSADANQASVSLLVREMRPDAVLTVGDNTYGGAGSFGSHVGLYYGDYILRPEAVEHPDYRSATTQRFFPVLGNHDWDAGVDEYLAYFSLSPDERYYRQSFGPIDAFFLSSDDREPDGVAAGSVQERWFRQALLKSDAEWKIVLMHHPAYTSRSTHGPREHLRWAFTGTTLVLQGHNHFYERIETPERTHVTVGNGGKDLYAVTKRDPLSQALDTTHHGFAMLEATPYTLTLTAYTSTGGVLDRRLWTR